MTRYEVVKEWQVRLQICIFTMPIGATVQVGQYDPVGSKYFVQFTARDIAWISSSELLAHCRPIRQVNK